ncbi:hypothetical protein G7061_09170 [Erysipelothrix sp. HDW6B]|uniref:hypothetical protein n=1 Tax=Erysipelothrix TaxID=1647 RepID=UPI0013583BB2|nr:MULTISPECIES: hypothetical protein [Erysipelothrix]QIK86771.1 hypothetical protein G7061_09170 [Erysipelothrix sp. HDW6B]
MKSNIKRLKQSKFLINEGVIEYNNHLIQIRNITRIACGKLDISIPYFRIILGVILGIALVKMPTPFSVAGFMLMVVSSMIAGYYAYMRSFSSLNFQLASGDIVAFESQDLNFLEKSYNTVKKIIEEGGRSVQKVEFDFTNATITNSNIAAGDVTEYRDIKGSTINSTVKDSVVSNVGGDDKSNHGTIITESSIGSMGDISNINIDYVQVTHDLELSLEQITDSEEKKKIEKAIAFSKANDQKGLLNAMKNLAKPTIEVLNGLASLATILSFTM